MTRAELIEALKSAKGPDREIDVALMQAFNLSLTTNGLLSLTASLDAALSPAP